MVTLYLHDTKLDAARLLAQKPEFETYGKIPKCLQMGVPFFKHPVSCFLL